MGEGLVDTGTRDTNNDRWVGTTARIGGGSNGGSTVRSKKSGVNGEQHGTLRPA